MSGEPRRFLLDQGFPRPRLPIEELDARVEFSHLSDWAPELARVSTPDWLVFLHAGDSGEFDGIVTRDQSIIRDERGLVALMDTKLSLITWKEPIEDPVTEWAQLLAFQTEIHKWLDRRADVIILLPRPQLRKDQVRVPRALLGERASRDGVSFTELRGKARREMNSDLRYLGRKDLLLADSGGESSP